MTKQKRELLILAGILIVIAVLLIVRLGGEGDIPPFPVTANVPPAGRTVTPGTAQPGGTGNPRTLLITQAPVEMLNPMFSDSAVTARIEAGAIRDPFASVHRTASRASSRQPTRQQASQPSRISTPPPLREFFLDDWPDDVEYGGLIPRVDAPGEYSVRFNGRPMRVGEKIPGTEWNDILGTEWELREASRLLIVIRREVKNDTKWEITWYRYVIMQLMESDR